MFTKFNVYNYVVQEYRKMAYDSIFNTILLTDRCVYMYRYRYTAVYSCLKF